LMVSQKIQRRRCASTSSVRKVGAARRAARYRVTRRVAPTIGFARLASGAFYEIIKIGR
jgi:hypothetical protein